RLQPAERAFDRPPNVVARAARQVGAVVHGLAELRREQHALTAPRQRAADVLLARALRVDVRGVEEGDARAEGGVDHGARLLVVAAAAEVVRAEADERDLGPAVAERARAHVLDAIRAGRAEVEHARPRG